ncbi:hypothetical protein LPJ61_003747, partial [Coemansia biformis]
MQSGRYPGPPGSHSGPPGGHSGPPTSYSGPPTSYPGPPGSYDVRLPQPRHAAYDQRQPSPLPRAPPAYVMPLPGVAEAAMHYQPAGLANASSGSSGARDSGSPYALHPPPPSFRHRAYGSTDSLYPSTLHPSRHIQSHFQSQQHQPVKLLQSCDSCRRRKIRCSGEKPTCSSCIRYQEHCHYSPLATPRRRLGKRTRTSADDGILGDDQLDDDQLLGDELPGDRRPDSEQPQAVAPADYAARPDAPAAVDEGAAAAAGGTESWRAEADAMRRDVATLARKFDGLGDKLDALICAIGKRRRTDGSSELSDVESSDESLARSHRGPRRAWRSAHVGAEFPNLVDTTSRFGLDSTNVGIISHMMDDYDRARGNEQQGSQLSEQLAGHSIDKHGSRPPEQQQPARQQPARQKHGAGDSETFMPAAETQPRSTEATKRLESAEMRSRLVETFYQSSDVSTVALIPRHIFEKLQSADRTPATMMYVMLAHACSYPDAEAVLTMERAQAQAHFIERAYRSLFECLEYDSAEHCVALMLFAIVIPQAGLHRAWIMQSLSMQMAIRLRFNTLDSPLSAPAFSGDSELVREWKRRVFWQMCALDTLPSTLGDLPPWLLIRNVRCQAPRAMTAEDVSREKADGGHLAMLGPAVVLCDDQQTLGLQVELLEMICDIGTLQSCLMPEEGPFSEEFFGIHQRMEQWQQRMPHHRVLAEGCPARVSREVRERPGLVSLELLLQYARILLYLIKDTWLPVQRTMTEKEQDTLAWTREAAREAAQTVHRLVPLIWGMRLSSLSSFAPCVVFQACVTSMSSCSWDHEPHRILAAVKSVQSGLGFLEHVSPRWGFAGVLMAPLRSMIIEHGFGLRNSPGAGHVDEETTAPASDQTTGGQFQPAPTEDMEVQPFADESPW